MARKSFASEAVLSKVKLPRVLIIYTGGTFGMDVVKGNTPLQIPQLSPSSLRKRMFEFVPELNLLARCDVEVMFNRDSAHIGPSEWIALAHRIQQKWQSYDGVVVLHGTDTLSYTASALSFLLRPCLKPVVITGAQRPLAALRTDARRNLVSAVEIAAQGPRPMMNQVMVFFDDRLLQGNRSRKRSASEFAAFESPKAAPLALVGTTIRYQDAFYRRPAGAGRALRPTEKLIPSFSSNVVLMHVTPGFPARAVSDHLLEHLDAMVLVIFASGTGPTHEFDFIRMLRLARHRGVPVVIVTDGVTQAPVGAAHPMNYEAGSKLLDEGCYWAGQMTPECAYVKTTLLLGQTEGRRLFPRRWAIEYAGEGSG